jgi:hypothetical protein
MLTLFILLPDLLSKREEKFQKNFQGIEVKMESQKREKRI